MTDHFNGEAGRSWLRFVIQAYGQHGARTGGAGANARREGAGQKKGAVL